MDASATKKWAMNSYWNDCISYLVLVFMNYISLVLLCCISIFFWTKCLLSFSDLHFHYFKVDDENTNKKAFLILNELIVALKVCLSCQKYTIPVWKSGQGWCMENVVTWNIFFLWCHYALFIQICLLFMVQSKKESRKLAYDVLLAVSTNLRSSESSSADSDLQRLFTMVS
jgi:ribosomal RNA-processing protein 12